MIARTLTAASAFIALTLPASARDQIIAPDREGQVIFVTPTGNVGCTYTPKGGTAVYTPAGGGPELICERVEPRYVTVILSYSGAAKRIDNPGEQGCCSVAPKLAYGNRWSRGPFTCSSAETGLTCSASGGHGFFISRGKITVR